MENGKEFDSGLVMSSSGHAANKTCNLNDILENKFNILGKIAIHDDNKLSNFIKNIKNIEKLNNDEIRELYQIEI